MTDEDNRKQNRINKLQAKIDKLQLELDKLKIDFEGGCFDCKYSYFLTVCREIIDAKCGIGSEWRDIRGECKKLHKCCVKK